MKKFLALLISVAMVLALVAIPAAAEGEVVFTVATVNDVNPGDTVQVPITVSNMGDNEAHTLVSHLYYNADMLTVNNVANGPLLSGVTPIIDWTTNTGDVAIGILGIMGGMTGDGVLCTVEFTVNENCTTDQPLDYEVEQFYNNPLGGEATEIPAVAVDGAININGAVPPPTEVPPTEVPPTEVPPTEVPPTEVPPTEVPPTNPPAGDDFIVGYYFETDPEDEGWVFVDQDGDGYNWMWLMYGVNYSYESAYEGYGLLSSASYASYTALNPDNWAISPAVNLAGGKGNPRVTFYVAAQDPSYPSEHYAVYAGTSADPASMTLVRPEAVLTTDVYEQITVDLSQFAGQTVYVAFRHFNCYDMFRMNIDQVEFWGNGDVPPTVPPTDVPPTDVPPTDVPPTTPPTEPEAGSATITVGSEYNVPGGATITLPVTIEGEYNAHTFNGVITYDPAKLTLVDSHMGTMVPGDAFIVFEDNNGVISIGLVMPGEPMNGEGSIVDLTFEVVDPFTEETPVTINVYEMNYVPETTGIPVELELVDGIVTPTGDVPPTDVPPTDVPPVEGVVFTMGSEYEVPGGAEIVLPLTIAGEYEAHILNMDITYDPAKLTVTDVIPGEILAAKDEAPVIIVDYNTPGRIAIGVIMPDQPFSGEGKLFDVCFTVADPFEEETPVEITVKEFAYMPIGESVAEPIEYTVVNGVVTPIGVPGPTDVPPTDVPPTDVPPTDEPGPTPPNPPVTGTASLIGLGILAIAAGAGVVIFRRKED